MKRTGLEAFDSTIQRTNVWLKDLMQELNWSDHRATYVAFRSVLHAVRDHLPINEAILFGGRLPMLIRGLYFEQWDLGGKPLPLRSRNDFLSTVSNLLAQDSNGADAEVVSRAVFRLLDRRVTDGEIGDLLQLMPGILHDLWPPTRRAA